MVLLVGFSAPLKLHPVHQCFSHLVVHWRHLVGGRGAFKLPIAKSPLTARKAEPTWGGEVERLGLVIFKTLPRCF